MPLTLVATIGSATANTYALQADATALAEELYPVPGWATVGSGDRDRCLVTATRLLDRLSFVGRRVDAVQALEWPRMEALKPGLSEYFDTDELPSAVVRACSRLAIWLADQDIAKSGDPTLSGNLAGLSSFSLGGEFSASFEPGQSVRSAASRFFTDEIRPILAGLVYAAQPRLVRG